MKTYSQNFTDFLPIDGENLFDVARHGVSRQSDTPGIEIMEDIE